MREVSARHVQDAAPVLVARRRQVSPSSRATGSAAAAASSPGSLWEKRRSFAALFFCDVRTFDVCVTCEQNTIMKSV